MTEPTGEFILLICEGPSDPRVARGFAERVCQERIEWLRDSPEAFLPWRGLEDRPKLPKKSGEDPEYLKWSSVKTLYNALGLPDINGRFDGQPEKPKATVALKALRLAAQRQPSAVVMVCDADNQPESRAGLEQARRKYEVEQMQPVPVVIGVADRCREAWVLVGYVPRNAREQERHKTLTRELTFDPSREPHRLRHPRSGQARHAKDVLENLCDGDLGREQPCWAETPLETLKENGEACGLKAYLEEIETRLVPVYDPGKAQ
jgi:hypothetical protein